MTKEEIIVAVEKMTILELADLVEALEKKFKVSAAMPTVAPVIETAAEPVEKEQTEFSVFVTAVGNKKVPLIKEVKAFTGLTLLESKKLVDEMKRAIVMGVDKRKAEEVKTTLEKAGATVEIK